MFTALRILGCGLNRTLEVEGDAKVNNITCTGVPNDHYVMWYINWTDTHEVRYAGYCLDKCLCALSFISIERPKKKTSVIRLFQHFRKRGLSGISCVDYNNKTKKRIHYNCTIRVRGNLTLA